MSNSFDELTSMIQLIVLDTVKFNVPRMGRVSQNKDPEGKGRILVHIDALGWDSDESGAWAYPHQTKALITPEIDDFVIVEFIDGDRDFPIYSGISSNMKGMIPKSYKSKDTQALYESNKKDFSIVYDEAKQKLTLGNSELPFVYDSKNSMIKIGAADESYVKGDTTKTELQKNIDALATLQANFNAWVPAPGDGGTALKLILSTGFNLSALASLSAMLSEKIKGE